MRRRYSVTYTQSLHAVSGLIAVGRVGTYFVDAPLIALIRLQIEKKGAELK